ncbi:penicillin-binding protein [Patescibacteria group bacterium]|nr:penicillin-binding protein [Patescibacteria group bacterium]
MPIPQLSNQNWRDQRKRSFISRDHKAESRHTQQTKKPTSTQEEPRKKSSDSPLNRLFKKIIKKIAYLFFILLFLAILGSGIFAFFTFLRLSASLPDPNSLIDREIAQTTKIYDRTGETLLYEIHGDEQRTLTTIENIPLYVKQATIAIEDKDFYNHKGFSLWAMARTMVTNVLRGQKAGGSTLTQQLIKNAILTNEKTYTRKIKELIFAYQVEKRFSKDEILQMYLNEIPYGSTAYGIEAASRKYFNKKTNELSLAEGAVLAALPQAPSRYSPYGPNRDLLIARQHYLLDQMVEQGYINKEDAEVAKEEEIIFKEPTQKIIAPHFVMYVKEQLGNKYGEKIMEQGGLKIITTIDLYKQKIAEDTINAHAEELKNKFSATNAALVAIDPKTGQILTMVGSKDYFSKEIDGQVNITTSLRQPGSSIKPLVYAVAFEKGYTPDTILYDVVTNFSVVDEEDYTPHNYDSKEYGAVTMKKALAGSLNIPAVKTLYLTGVKNVLKFAHDSGYTTLADIDKLGLSLVLGGGEVKMIEHANAFSIFAREGELHSIASILKVEDKDGNVLEEFRDKKFQVLNPRTARIINSILSDNGLRAYAFGTRNWLYLDSRPNATATKTGTTNNYRDAWTIGYTPSIVTAVWVGNNDNSIMKKGAAGGKVAAPIWHDFMQKVLGDSPIEEFKKPDQEKTGKKVLDGEEDAISIVKIDKASNLLATDYTPESYIEERMYYMPHSILSYINKDDPRGEAPTDPKNDWQYDLWENAITKWAASSSAELLKKYKEENKIPEDEEVKIMFEPAPTEEDNLHTEENIPQFEISSPKSNETINDSLLYVNIIKATAPRGIAKADFFIDNQLLFTNNKYPFNFVKNIGFLHDGLHDLKVKLCDNVDNCKEIKQAFNLQLSDDQRQAISTTISWEYPSTGLSINSIDFPLDLEVNIGNPEQIKNIDYYYTSEGSTTPQIISSLSSINSNKIIYKWDQIPPTNSYTLYAEAIKLDGQIIRSSQAKILIKKSN